VSLTTVFVDLDSLSLTLRLDVVGLLDLDVHHCKSFVDSLETFSE